MADHDDMDPVRAELEKLLASPGSCGFFEVVRFLSKLWPQGPTPGDYGPYLQERVRFVQDPSLAFPAGDISDIRREQEPPPEHFVVQATFLGLSGAGSPLPTALVADLCIQDESLDADRAFLDWIHHRIYGLFYKASDRLAQIREAPQLDRQSVTHPQLELIGPLLGQGSVSQGASFQDCDLLDVAPALTQGNASLELVEMAVARVLEPFLGPRSRITLRPMTGAWAHLQAEDRWTLGAAASTLGANTMLGDQAWVRSLGVTLRIDAVPWELYQSKWVQGQEPLLRLRDLCGLLVADPLVWELEIEVVQLPVHGWTLAKDALGASSWLLGPECETLIERRTLTEHLHRRQSEAGT